MRHWVTVKICYWLNIVFLSLYFLLAHCLFASIILAQYFTYIQTKVGNVFCQILSCGFDNWLKITFLLFQFCIFSDNTFAQKRNVLILGLAKYWDDYFRFLDFLILLYSFHYIHTNFLEFYTPVKMSLSMIFCNLASYSYIHLGHGYFREEKVRLHHVLHEW